MPVLSRCNEISSSNTAGAMTGFMGMGMAGQAGGANMQNLYQMGRQQQAAQQQAAQNMQLHPGQEHGNVNVVQRIQENSALNVGKPKPQREEWICSCGAVNTGKFCSECGSPRPTGKWTCSCGAVNTGSSVQNVESQDSKYSRGRNVYV